MLSKNDLEFLGGAVFFLGAFFFYAFIARGTLWSIPVVLVALGCLVLMTMSQAKEMSGRASTEQVKKAALYTIGFNVSGGILYVLGTLIWRSMQ